MVNEPKSNRESDDSKPTDQSTTPLNTSPIGDIKTAKNPENKTKKRSKASQYAQYIVGRLVAVWRLLGMVIRLLDKYDGAITAIATAAIVVLTFVYVKYSKRQWEVMRDQLSITQADLRPWIKVEAEFYGPLDTKLPLVPLQFTATNIGKSPSIAVRIGVRTFLVTSSHNGLYGEMRKYCEEFRNTGSVEAGRGAILFPTEHTIINKVREGYIIPGISPDDLKNYTVDTAIGKRIDLWVYGCVDYVYGSEQRHHQSRFAYRIMRLINRPPLPDGIDMIDPKVVVPPEKLMLLPSQSATVEID